MISPDFLQYTIWFNNTGTSDAGFVWINDTLPAGVTWDNDTAHMLPEFAGSWDDGTIWYYNFTNLAQGTYSFVINVTVDFGLSDGTYLNNTASLEYTNATGAFNLPPSWSNTTTMVTNVSMVVVKTTANITADPGDIIQYFIYFNVTGSDDAQYVNITDVLPAGVSWNSDNSSTIPVFIGFVSSGQFLWYN